MRRLLLFALFFLLSGRSHSLKAQVATWTGSLDTRWEMAGNWSPAIVPTTTSDALVNACTVCPRLPSNVSIRSLNLKSGSRLDLNGQTLTLSDSAAFYTATVTGNGGTIRSAKVLKIEFSTFNGNLTLECTGSTANYLKGGNTFNQDITVRNSGTGPFRLASLLPDTFPGNVTFVKEGTGSLEPAYSGNNTFAGNIAVTGALHFAAGSGAVLTFNGTADQALQSTSALICRKLVVNKTQGNLNLLASLTLTENLNLVRGNLVIGNTHVFLLSRLASVTGGSNLSYVVGNLRKRGNAAFTFPVGDQGKYRPLTIGDCYVSGTTPADTAVTVTAGYLGQKQSMGNAKSSPKLSISDCEHWLLTPSVAMQFTVSLDKSNACNYRETNQACIARCLGNTWQREAVALPVGSLLTTSQKISFPNTTTALTMGYWGQLTLNTTAVQAAAFSLSGAGISLSALAGGSPQSIIPLFPVFAGTPKQTLLINIAGSTGVQPLQLSVELDSTGLVSANAPVQVKASGTWSALRKDYYAITDDLYGGKTLFFYAEPPTANTLSLRTNLQQGLLLTNTFLIAGLTNLKAKLQIVGKDNTLYLVEKKNFRGDTISWNTLPIANNLNAVTEFVLTVQDKNLADFILKGHFIKK
jgi:hypothetical protein